MNCDEARRHWNLYHDSEGDADLFFRINEHLAACPACAEWFYRESLLEDRVEETLRPGEATPELWRAIVLHAGVEQPQPVRRWFVPAWFTALAASLLLAIGGWLLFGQSQTASADLPDLAKVTAEYHEKFADGTKPVAFASGSDLEVEHYLRGEVNFPVRCPPRSDSGFLVRGAGVCRNPGCDLVYLVGHVEEAPVSVFVLSRGELKRFPEQVEAVRRTGMHQWREGPNEMLMAEIDQSIVLVVGRTDRERLVRVLKAYGSYPHNHI
jgi:anti-sigma factor RsiW